MYLDTDVVPTKHLWVCRGLFLVLVLGLCYGAGLVWWQLLAVVVVALVCLWHDISTSVPVFALSAKNPNELWELGVYDDRQIWQGYLNEVWRVDFGFGRALRLSFYVVEPHKQPLKVWVFSDSVPVTTFRQLCALTHRTGAIRGGL